MSVIDLTNEPLRRLSEMKAAHRALDNRIRMLSEETGPNQLEIGRLKKLKLKLKDQITHLEDQITPDIIA
ncbi:MAG: YdcH family protein [Geminicoccaceae bacterium]